MGDLSLLATGLKVVVVFGLLFATLRIVARVNGGRSSRSVGPGRTGDLVEVVDRTALGKGSAVAVVRMGDTHYALGVTEQHINVLAEVPIDLDRISLPAGTPVDETRSSWRELVEGFRERSVRR